jgi:dTDP-glucose 4,6-dehydratase
MKILVTGSEGTLGKPLCAQLTANGHDVYGCDLQHTNTPNVFRADVGEYRQLDALFKSIEPDVVFHLAAEFGRLNGEMFYEQLWKSNAVGTKNVLTLQNRYHFRLIFASSSEIYGDYEGAPPLTESLPDKIPNRPGNDYAISKWVNELQVLNHLNTGQQIMRLRFFNAYGPGEYYHPYRSVVCLFTYRALMGIPWTVYRDYHRVFMYIDDFIPTLAAAADKFANGEVVNIGGSEYRSVEDLSGIILKNTGADPSLVTYLDQDAHNIVNKQPDITKAKDLLGHDPTIVLEEGVSRTLDWMREVYADSILHPTV